MLWWYLDTVLIPGVILSEFEAISGIPIKRQDVEAFTVLWMSLDPQGSGLIAAKRLEVFVATLACPLGLHHQQYSRHDLRKRVGKNYNFIKEHVDFFRWYYLYYF
jgi:hypothetical protein